MSIHLPPQSRRIIQLRPFKTLNQFGPSLGAPPLNFTPQNPIGAFQQREEHITRSEIPWGPPPKLWAGAIPVLDQERAPGHICRKTADLLPSPSPGSLFTVRADPQKPAPSQVSFPILTDPSEGLVATFIKTILPQQGKRMKGPSILL